VRVALSSGIVLMLAACGSTPATPDLAAVVPTDAVQTDPAAQAVPEEAVRRFDQAVADLSEGDLAGAEQELNALAAEYPTYSGPPLNLGILHAKAGRLRQAEQALREAVARNDANAAAYNELGIVYRRLGRFAEADEAYGHAVRVDPQYAPAYLNLGVLCDLYLQQPRRALEAYERYLALAATPDEKVGQWVAELRRRLGAGPQAARTEAAEDGA